MHLDASVDFAPRRSPLCGHDALLLLLLRR